MLVGGCRRIEVSRLVGIQVLRPISLTRSKRDLEITELFSSTARSASLIRQGPALGEATGYRRKTREGMALGARMVGCVWPLRLCACGFLARTALNPMSDMRT